MRESKKTLATDEMTRKLKLLELKLKKNDGEMRVKHTKESKSCELNKMSSLNVCNWQVDLKTIKIQKHAIQPSRTIDHRSWKKKEVSSRAPNLDFVKRPWQVKPKSSSKGKTKRLKNWVNKTTFRKLTFYNQGWTNRLNILNVKFQKSDSFV